MTYNKAMTDTLKEYYKIRKCIEKSEDIDQLNAIWETMYKHFVNKVNHREKTICSWRCFFNHKSFKELCAFKRFSELCAKELYNLGNGMVNNFQAEYDAQQKAEDKRFEIECQMEALKEYYQPHVEVKGFKQ